MNYKYIIIVSIMAILCSCYEQIEGCLDPFSSNYAYSADTNCESCCKFPSVSINLKGVWNEETLDPKMSYLNVHRQSLRLLSSRFLISSLNLVSEDGQHTSSSDTTTILCNTGSVNISDDLKVISNINQSYNVSNFRLGGDYIGINFNLGLTDCLSSIDTSLVQENFTSYSELSILKESNSVSGIAIDIFRELEQDTLSLHIKDTDSNTDIMIEGDFQTTRGSNYNLTINLDYSVLLNDIDLSDDIDFIQNKIIENYKFAFSID